MRAGTVVAHLVGVQAQLPRAAGLALAARTDGLTEDAVARARVDERSIVLTWAMRGTFHLIAADDLRFVPVLTEPHVGGSLRRLWEEGVTADDAERACDLIERMLASEGALTRPEVATRLRRRRIRTEGQAIAHLVWLAAARRGICVGPDRGGERTFVLARDWIGGSKPRADHEGVVRELAVRYLRSHAPATAGDFAAWSGIRLRDARTAWTALAPRARQVRTASGLMTIPRTRLTETRAGDVRLLPDLDEYLLGWRDRGFAVPAERRRDVNAGGGFLRPVVLRDGTAVATWRFHRAAGGWTIEVDAFAPMTSSARRAVVGEATRFAAFVGTPTRVSFGKVRVRD